MILVVWLIVGSICGAISGSIGASKGRSGFGWFLAGFCLGIIGIVIVAIASPLNQAAVQYQEAIAAPGRAKKCPDCAEVVRIDANVCKHCGYRFSEEEAPIDPRARRPDVDTSKWSKLDRENWERRYAPEGPSAAPAAPVDTSRWSARDRTRYEQQRRIEPR